MPITPLQRLYRQISQPSSPPSPPPARMTTEAKPITLTRADVDAILQRERSASPAELEYAISRSKELALSDRQRNQLGIDLSILMAQRSRGMNGRRDDPAAEFMHKVLGLAETPYGMIERSWVNQHLQSGSQAIARCRNHRPPECVCWSASRASLWQASTNGEKTPEAWAAAQIYDCLEELEMASRPESEAGRWTGWQGRANENLTSGQYVQTPWSSSTALILIPVNIAHFVLVDMGYA